jgi:hypothetical protein
MEKSTRFSFLPAWRWILPMLAFLLGNAVSGAPAFSVTPSTMADNNLGTLTLQISGLQAGETVYVGKYLDANGNGAPDAGDSFIQGFALTDGQAITVGGVTNINIPYDSNATAGTITAKLNLKNSGIEQQFVGKYLYMVISSTGRFSPLAASFQISNAVRGQFISGDIKSGGTAVPNALVLLFTPSGDNMSPQGGIVADSAGHFKIQAAPGNYMVTAFRSNYVANMSGSPGVSLGTGASATANITLVPATCHITGHVVDVLDSESGLPGILLPVENDNGGLAIGFSDANGAFDVPVTAGQWKINPDTGNLRLLGFCAPNDSTKVDTSTGGVSGLDIQVPRSDALVYGHVLDASNKPLKGVSLYGDDGRGMYENDAVTDDNGLFVMGVIAGSSWYLGVDDGYMVGNAPYIFTQQTSQIPVQSGQNYQQNFTGAAANYHIAGTVKNEGGNAVAGVGIYVYGNINNVTYGNYTETDDDGNYSIPVAAGTWMVSVNCTGDDGLSSMGYTCVDEQTVLITSVDGIANFTASSCQPLSVASSSLQSATMGNYYYTQLQANGCQTPFQWSLASGSQSLPPGLTLSSNGDLSGTCESAGNFTFTVRVTDAGMNTAERQLTLNVIGSPLQISTYQLPNGTINSNYTAQVSAIGGQPPYIWSVAPGSAGLPANLSLASDGAISGIPTSAGTTYFYLRVTDAASAYVDQMFSLTFLYPELAIETSALPAATVGQPYEGQLVGTGGLTPYFWSLALGSANLPNGLALGTNGVVSGTPTTSGSFYFMANLRDATFNNTTRLISLQIQAAAVRPAISAAGKLGTSQFQFTITGTAGQTYSIETTPDFKNWTSVLVTNAPSDSFVIQVDRSTSGAAFYRVKVGQ